MRQVHLLVDATLYTGPATGPGWKPSYVTSGNVAPVSALEVDEGRKNPAASPRVADPAAAAGASFAALLKAGGIEVVGSPVPGTAPDGATVLAAVSSPPVSALVDRLLQRSDNDLAEALGRQVAIHEGLPASFAGAAEATMRVLASLGVAPSGLVLADNSGLSRDDRVTVTALTQLLRLAASADHPQLRSVAVGLPVGGFSGTLSQRFGTGATVGAGVVRAKTGTLDGVSSLAGYATDADGRLLAFAFVSNGVPVGSTTKAEAALDKLAAVLAGCGCR